jgi:hypothetical protein
MIGKLLSNRIASLLKGREARIETRIDKAKKTIRLNAKERTARKLENLAGKPKKKGR